MNAPHEPPRPSADSAGAGTAPHAAGPGQTEWERGRFAGSGARRVLFGSMYEDPAIELSVFAPGGRVFCIASSGDTAFALSAAHAVLAVDINPVQLAYAQARAAGAPRATGTAEQVMALGRRAMRLAGWSRARLETFLAFDDCGAQLNYWHAQLDTQRFRLANDALLSVSALKAVYSSGLLASLPDHFGRVLRARLERSFARHPNARNPYARLLFAGEADARLPQRPAGEVQWVEGDAAGVLEAQPAGSLAGFTLSNILDGATPAYRARLAAAVRRAAAPGAMLVLRSFGEPAAGLAGNRAADDRSMLWGVVQVSAAADWT
jgi:S-adenosylmethionine:diacylglycerol 3-amino-3-carboxypropyl transferase